MFTGDDYSASYLIEFNSLTLQISCEINMRYFINVKLRGQLFLLLRVLTVVQQCCAV